MKTALSLTAVGLALIALVAFVTPRLMKPTAPTAPAVASSAPAAQTTPTPDCRFEGTIPIANDAPIPPGLARLTSAEAEDAALAAVPGATLTDLDLDEEDGFLVYEIDLTADGAEVDVLVDAGDGEVLCIDRD